MIPIVTDPLEVQRVSIYNQSVLQRYPLNGARVKNTTDKHLLQGPITVLDGGAYAGDARIDDLPPGQQRFVSYGIDLQVEVDVPEQKYNEEVEAGTISKGVLKLTRKIVSGTTYVAVNRSGRDKTIVFEYPREKDEKLLEPKAAEEVAPETFRFFREFRAGGSVRIAIQTQSRAERWVQILQAGAADLEAFVKTERIAPKVREALAEALRLKGAISDAERQVKERAERSEKIAEDQTRIRENLKTVSPESDYAKRLLAKLDEQETTLEQLATETAQLQADMGKLTGELQKYLAELTVE